MLDTETFGLLLYLGLALGHGRDDPAADSHRHALAEDR